MPDITKYDGTMGPQEHVTSYTCAIKGNDVDEDEIESVLLKKFGETLSEGALTWYDYLPEHSITSFEMLADAFIKAHAGAKKVQARKADIFRITQTDNELLREFVSRFQIELIELPSIPEEWAAQAFTKGINPRSSTASFKLKENLLEYEVLIWADVHNRDIPRLSEYNFNINTTDLVSAIGHIKDARWPRPLRSDPAQRDPSVMCEYHGTHGHRTEDCRQLKEDVAWLLKNGHLREFLSERAKGHYKGRENHKQVEPVDPKYVINLIIGGTDAPRGPMMKRTKVSIV
ncbi:uncharacterized protein LOC132624125 [Lycium barbarum]|uniref:uncharacterized protein LOC132624125 n=1 Tax=Lycium barbarum TaxID=112863 RepID=UPI00293E9BF7|nr:uncharacterized protein LOC132624125 [Lycium barbarum]